MKIKAQVIGVNNDSTYKLVEIPIESIKIDFPCVMSIDGSTDVTGVALLREGDGAIAATIAFERKDETPVAYKVRLKRAVQDILRNNRQIRNVFYEEPFIGYAKAAANLLMLRVFIEEIKVENEPEFDYLTYKEVNNKKWKKLFLAPQTCPTGTDLEKAAVRQKLLSALPYLNGITQDEIDAISMGFVAINKLKDGDESDLESKTKPRPFQYNIHFIGAEDEQVAIQELFDTCTVPGSVLENGIAMSQLSNRGKLEEKIFETMGHEDKLVIVSFTANKHGDIILQHKIGYLAASFATIYAVVWRKTRK